MVTKAPASRRQYPYSKEKEQLLARLRKIEGQARGIQRMVEEDRYCVDILQQLTALTSATEEVALILLQGHIQGCVSEAIQQERGEPAIREVMEVVRRFLRR